MSIAGEKFEDKLERVKNIVDDIEKGKLTLEDTVKQYEEGMKILGALDRELADMKRRITVIRDDGDEREFAAQE